METKPAKPRAKKASDRQWILPKAPRLGDFAIYGKMSDEELNEYCEREMQNRWGYR